MMFWYCLMRGHSWGIHRPRRCLNCGAYDYGKVGA